MSRLERSIIRLGKLETRMLDGMMLKTKEEDEVINRVFPLWSHENRYAEWNSKQFSTENTCKIQKWFLD